VGELLFCANCGAPNDDDDTTCFRCGTEFGQIITCPFCGLDVLTRKLVCPRCDTVLHPHTDEWGNEWEAGDEV